MLYLGAEDDGPAGMLIDEDMLGRGRGEGVETSWWQGQANGGDDTGPSL